MDSVSELFVLNQYSFWLGLGLCGVLFYLSTLSDPIYRNYKRVGGGLSDWVLRTPIYDHVKHGYERYSKPLERPFVVNWWAKDYVVMPQRYLAELRGADPKALSFFQNIQDALWLEPTAGDLYTAKSGERMIELVTKGINPRLPQIVPSMIEEINIAFDAELGNHSEQYEVTAFKFFGAIARRVAVRLLIGQELCRKEQFLKALDDFTWSIFESAMVITKSPLGPLRSVLAPVLAMPRKRKLKRCCQHVVPIIKTRLDHPDIRHGADEAFDGLDFTLQSARSSSDDLHRDTADSLAVEMMHSLWAASSSPGGMMAEVVYQLLSDSKYIAPLREEAFNAVSQFGWTEKMLNNLEKQDSFIREVNRLYPTGAMGIARTVMKKDFQCSNGLMLATGTRIVFPLQAIQSDSDNFLEAQVFDGFRFVSKKDEDSATRDNATTMGLSNLAWGYGNHMCPGRFFAIRECKIVLTKLILEYEIGWNRIEDGKPPRMHVEGQFVPNMSQTILLRKRVPVTTGK